MTDQPSTREQLARLVPMAVCAIALGVTTEMLVAVRPVEPSDLPVPVLDETALAKVADEDRAAASRVESSPPPVEIRAIGSAFLALNEEDAAIPTSPQHESLLRELRSAMGVARQKLGDDGVKKELVDLRADHTERWLCTLRRVKLLDVDPFCRTLLRDHPKADDAAELHRLGGSLAEIMTHTGWIDGSGMPRVPESILRARYAMFWTSTVYGLDTCERAAAPVCFGLTSLPLPAEEVRALIAFLIAHPVVWVTAPTDDAAAAADRRRLVYIDRLQQLDAWADPSGKTHTYSRDYPIDLARGALYYRLGQWANAAEALRRAVDANHSDFRARNWLLATLEKIEG